MKIMVFLQGTAIMHKSGLGKTREERVKQVANNDSSIQDYQSYVPVGKVVEKLKKWEEQGAQILYLSSQENTPDIEKDKLVLKRYSFPLGQIYFRDNGTQYKDIVEKIMPDVLIEDDCESIGGEREMTYTNINPQLKAKIKSIVVKEFSGIDHLPIDITNLL